MYRRRTYAIEAHDYAATIYLIGEVSVRAVLEALRRCEHLPHAVWLLRVDLSAAEPLDAGTHTVLAEALRRWRERRAGVTQVLTPGQRFPFAMTTRRAAALALRQRAAVGRARIA